jgi:Putative adhesin
MNRRNRNLYLLPMLALAAAACTGASGPRHETTVERKWPAAQIKRVEVHEVDGSVTVEAGKPDEIALTAHVRSTDKPQPQKENQGYFDSEVQGDTLEIGRHGERRVHVVFFQIGPETSINYTLHVPPSIALELHTVNGRIATRGIDAATEAHTVNGEIDLEASGRSEVEAHAVNGRVSAKFLRDFQGARLKTVNGRVIAVLPPTSSFTCDVSQVNGDFEASFPLSIHSHPGSRRVSGEINGGQHELRISTVNGDIALENGVPPVPPVAPVPPPALPAPPAPPAPPRM